FRARTAPRAMAGQVPVMPIWRPGWARRYRGLVGVAGVCRRIRRRRADRLPVWRAGAGWASVAVHEVRRGALRRLREAANSGWARADLLQATGAAVWLRWPPGAGRVAAVLYYGAKRRRVLVDR